MSKWDFGFGFGFGSLYLAFFNGPLGRGNRRVGPGPLRAVLPERNSFASDRLTQRGRAALSSPLASQSLKFLSGAVV